MLEALGGSGCLVADGLDVMEGADLGVGGEACVNERRRVDHLLHDGLAPLEHRRRELLELHGRGVADLALRDVELAALVVVGEDFLDRSDGDLGLDVWVQRDDLPPGCEQLDVCQPWWLTSLPLTATQDAISVAVHKRADFKRSLCW